MRRSLKGSSRLPAEHLRHADGADAISAREPAGTDRSDILRSGRQGGRLRAREAAASVPQLRTSSLGPGHPLSTRSGDGRLAWRRSRRRRRRPRPRRRRQLHLRRTRQRRRCQARDQHPQDSAQPGDAATGHRRRDSGDGRGQRRLRRPRAALAHLQDLARRGPLSPRSQRRHEHTRPDGDVPDRHEHVPADDEERGDGLLLAVTRVLPLARSGQRQPRARLHDELDRRRRIRPARA